MDTASHTLFGLTLAGLAHLHPAVAHDPQLAVCAGIAVVLGSNAPDFDAVARIGGSAAYVKHHRGLSHSLPALLIWPALLGLPLAAWFGEWGHAPLLYAWTLLAVVFHVLLDLFNVYGVQCLRPFSRTWLHLDTLCLYEPFLFALHGGGLAVWALGGAQPGPMFAVIYGVTALYAAIRSVQRRQLVRLVQRELGQTGVCHVIPGLSWRRWQFVLETAASFYTGEIRSAKLRVQSVYPKAPDHPIIQATRGIDGVTAFLQFAQRVHVRWTERPDGCEVQWRDVRFWHGDQLPFGVDVVLDRNLNVVSQSVGWRKRAWDPPYV